MQRYLIASITAGKYKDDKGVDVEACWKLAEVALDQRDKYRAALGELLGEAPLSSPLWKTEKKVLRDLVKTSKFDPELSGVRGKQLIGPLQHMLAVRRASKEKEEAVVAAALETEEMDRQRDCESVVAVAELLENSRDKGATDDIAIDVVDEDGSATPCGDLATSKKRGSNGSSTKEKRAKISAEESREVAPNEPVRGARTSARYLEAEATRAAEEVTNQELLDRLGISAICADWRAHMTPERMAEMKHSVTLFIPDPPFNTESNLPRDFIAPQDCDLLAYCAREVSIIFFSVKHSR